MDAAPDTPKPKRRYAVTDKVREARRISLAKAREKARRALRGYRRGSHEDDVAYGARLDRQIKPWCTNLRRAVVAKKADRSANYASNFTHGLTAPDLDRSAEAAGEDRDDLRRHIERCWRMIGRLAGLASSELFSSEFGAPRSESAASETSPGLDNSQPQTSNPEPSNRQSPIESKLVLALAYVLWRALRLMRTQVRWDQWALIFRLRELAAGANRQAASENRQFPSPESPIPSPDRSAPLTPERLNQLRENLEGVSGDLVHARDRLRRLRKRFEALWTALFDPERWERLAEHIMAPKRVPNEAMYVAPGPSLLDLLVGGRRSRGKRRGKGQGDAADPGPDHPSGPPSPPAPRSPRGRGSRSASTRFDPLKWLCRTRSRGAQDWRLRLHQLAAQTLSLPFQSPANVERRLERQGRDQKPGAGDQRSGNFASPSPSNVERQKGRRRGFRAWNWGARVPSDADLARLIDSGQLVDITSLAELRELLARALGGESRNSNRGNRQPAAANPNSGVAALAEALWTRLEGFGELVATLEEMLARMLQYHSEGGGLGGLELNPAKRKLGFEAPTFRAVLKWRKAVMRAALRGSAAVPAAVAEASRLRPGADETSAPPRAGCPRYVDSRRNENRNSHTGNREPATENRPEPPIENSAAGLHLDDLWIETDPLAPSGSPLDGLRLWFEAADGVLRAGSHLEQKVDVALYEFAVRRFGIRREFVAWRPQLSLDQWRERRGRPEWEVQVTTVDEK